jgi:three-Cys-motif partner protein
MPDSIIWEISPHTLAKHLILKRYIQAWAPILAQGSKHKRLVYIDGFAGPGEYLGGEDGSPIVALKALKEHILNDNFHTEFVNLFIENDDRRAENLKNIIHTKLGELPRWIKSDVINGEFNKEMKRIMDELKNKSKDLAPCLCFVDPFGWEDLDYSVLSHFMKYEKSELLITFMSGYVSRFVWNESHMDSIRKLFTDEQIQEIKESSDRERIILRLFLENLLAEIKKTGINAEIFHLAFATYNMHNRMEYYLVYLSKSCKGFEAMKAAMFKISEDGSYRFSDFNFDPAQATLVDYGIDHEWIGKAAEELYDYLKVISNQKISPEFAKLLNRDPDEPRKIPISEAKTFITCRTVWKYNNSILKNLEDSGKITVHITKRKPGTYPDRGYLKVN